MSFLKVFAIFGIVGKWYDKAMADGEVTLAEGVQLLLSLATVVGMNVSPEVMAVIESTTDDVLEAVGDAVEVIEDVVEDLKEQGQTQAEHDALVFKKEGGENQ